MRALLGVGPGFAGLRGGVEAVVKAIHRSNGTSAIEHQARLKGQRAGNGAEMGAVFVGHGADLG